MEKGEKLIYNEINTKYVNRCKIYPKVFTISDITYGYGYKVYK